MIRALAHCRLRPVQDSVSVCGVSATRASRRVHRSLAVMSAADSDDEEIRRAIALSLGQPDPGTQKAITVPIDLTSNSPSPERVESWRAQIPSTILHSLDRAQMERERLARKRKADDSPISSPKPKASKLESTGSTPTAVLKYPNGVVKKTFCSGFPREGNDITLKDVLQPMGLKVAILSSFMWDVAWLFSHLNCRETRIVCVMQAKDDETKASYRQDFDDRFQTKNIRLCFPSMDGGVNCMHSKLMVLSYDNFLRIAVPTANLVPYDWGEDGTMENSVFIIDLPRLPTRILEGDLTPFGKALVYFLNAQGLEKTIVDSLCNFDFSATENLGFVHTIGGSHLGSRWQRTGYPGLSRAVRQLGLNCAGKLDVDFVTSSVGSLNMAFLSNLYRACQGDDFEKDAEKKKLSRKSPWNQSERVNSIEETINDHFRIYFPTHETVTTSIARQAGTICIQASYYNSPNFPRSLLRDCKSVRKGVLMHNKIIFVRPHSPFGSHPAQAWAYIGSANCSESAWGNKIVRDRASKELKLFARNWECGVIVKCGRRDRDTADEERKADENDEMEKGKEGGNEKEAGRALKNVFEGTVPVPMQMPREEYGDKKPWYFMGDG